MNRRKEGVQFATTGPAIHFLSELSTPHELDRLADGTGAVFSVRDTPWHREGTVLTEAPSREEALRLGGLGFEVEVRPLYTRVQPYPELPEVFSYQRASNACATVRTDRGSVLGIVSERYQPLQNRDAFGVLEPLLDAGLAALRRRYWRTRRFYATRGHCPESHPEIAVPGELSDARTAQAL